MINSIPKSLIDAATQVLLGESLDSPLALTPIDQDSMLHQMGAMSAAMIGGDNFKMAKIDGAGFMIQFDRKGATEIHHVNDDLVGGMKTGNAVHPARFISTMVSHIKGLVDSGKPVRIVAHHALADNFKRITDMVLKRNPGYHVSPVTDSEHEITGDAQKEWTISKDKPQLVEHLQPKTSQKSKGMWEMSSQRDVQWNHIK